MTEIERIQSGFFDEEPPAVGTQLKVKSYQGITSFEQTCEVMEVIASQDVDMWPSDEQWSKLLPDWFIQTFQDHTVEELQANKNLWDYGSWLDSMQSRGWQWWSAVSTPQEWKINLTAEEFPFRTSALEYLIRVSGGIVESIIEL